MKNSGKRTDILFGVDALGVNMYPKDNQLNPTVSNVIALGKKIIQVPLFFIFQIVILMFFNNMYKIHLAFKNIIIYREERSKFL